MPLVLMIVASPIAFASEAPLVPQRNTAANHRIIVRYLQVHPLPVGTRVRKVTVPRQNPVSSFPNVVTRYVKQDWTDVKVKSVPAPSFIDRGALIRRVNDIESFWRRRFTPILIDDTPP